MGDLDSSEETAIDEAGPADDELGRGATLGRYTVLGPVGSGGAGQVYAAYDPRLDRKIALKLIEPSRGRHPARAQARLLREAKVLAKLSHPNVVAVHDAGASRGRVFVAMEFVDGVTLEDWLAERPRTRPEILAAFTDAARGLAAAHAAGLVHRAFGPADVMIGNDGSVRVTDLGLARHVDDPAKDDLSGSGATTPRLAGTLRGRVRDPAPEQLAGGALDARTDQFSFCAALYRALTGMEPFGGDTPGTLAANVLAGRVEPPPPKAALPAWLRRVLLRGLSVNPDARWPSMSVLVDALGRDPARTRRRWGIAAGALTLVGLSALTLVRNEGRPAQLCLGGPARLAGVWEGATEPHARRTAVEEAFLATGAPGARDVWERVATLLDRYRASWLSMYRDACAATHVRGAQSAAALDLRMTCLGERRLALSALTNVFVAADRDVVENAVGGANALPALDGCVDLERLQEGVEPPRDEATRKRVEQVRERAADAKALNDTGKHEEAKKMVQAQIVEARALEYRPLLAEQLVALNRTEVLGNFDVDDVRIGEEAVWTSLSVGRDELAAEAAIGLVAVSAYLARYEDGLRWARVANAILDRAGDGHELLRSWLLMDAAIIEAQRHRSEQALDLITRALILKEKVLPPDHPDIAISLNNAANVLAQMGRNEEALRTIERAQGLFVKTFGPASVEVAFALNNRGEYLITLGRPAEALEPLRRSLAGLEAQFGDDGVTLLGTPLTAMGRALLALGRPEEAVPLLERALRLRERHEGDPLSLAETRFALARGLGAANGDGARARALAKMARAAYASGIDDKSASEIQAWLDDAPKR